MSGRTESGEGRRDLSAVLLFQKVAPERRALIESRCRWRQFEAGQEILAHGEQTTDIYFVASGAVRATFFTNDGKQVTFRDVQAGGYFGELAAIDKEPRAAAVVAIRPTTVALMGADQFLLALEHERSVAMALLANFARQVRFLTERVIEYSALDVAGRVRAELCRLARDMARGSDAVEIVPAPTHAEIASKVATHREAVTREMNALARAGIVERGGGCLRVRSVAALEATVQRMLGT